jgi:hypothetical protein
MALRWALGQSIVGRCHNHDAKTRKGIRDADWNIQGCNI